jgi:hypothetical protein
MVTEMAALITALAAWKWPVVVVVGLVLYRVSIGRLIDRTDEFEVSKSGLKAKMRELRDAAAQVEQEATTEPQDAAALPPATKALPPAPIEGHADIELGDATLNAQGTVGPAREQDKLDEYAHEVAAEAARSPKVALVLLSADIERNLRELLAATGWHRMRRVTSIPVGFEMLAEHAPVSPEIRDAVLKFWNVRNKLVHGGRVADDDVISAIDSGLKILKAIAALPREVNVVYHPGADVFSDAKGEHPVVSAKALILEQTASDGVTKHRRVYPTTRTDYVKGQLVAWEWNMGRKFGESWYRDPDTATIKYAWTSSAEFVGRPMDQVV